MLIGELCKRSNLSKDTIRHYESMGLLHPTKMSAGSRRYRHYDASSLERLELIQIGQTAGMLLRDMKPILDNLMAGRLSFDAQRGVVRDQIGRIDQHMAQLQEAKKLLHNTNSNVLISVSSNG